MADDDLIESYRQASAQDASRPSDATRVAIAARARELAALRHERAATTQFDTRTPAANEPSWKIRAVAALAVLMVGGSLFWQVYREAPRPLPTTVTIAPAPATVSEQSAAPPPAQASARPALEGKALDTREEARSDALASAAPAAEAPSGAGALSNRAVGRAQPNAAAIVARYFPDVPASGESGLWVLLDVRGIVLRTGRQGPADPAALKRYLEARYPGIVTAEVEALAASSRRGASLIRFVWLAVGSPPLDAEGAP